MASKGNKECKEQGERKWCHEHMHGTRKVPVPRPVSATPREGQLPRPPGMGQRLFRMGGLGVPCPSLGVLPGLPLSQAPTLWGYKGFRALERAVVPPALHTPPGLHKAPRPRGSAPTPGWAHQPPPAPLREDTGREKEPQS